MLAAHLRKALNLQISGRRRAAETAIGPSAIAQLLLFANAVLDCQKRNEPSVNPILLDLNGVAVAKLHGDHACADVAGVMVSEPALGWERWRRDWGVRKWGGGGLIKKNITKR
jgi:hypothetical protein